MDFLVVSPYWLSDLLWTGIDVLDRVLDARHAVLGVGVGAEELGWAVSGLGGGEDLHDADQLVWVIAGVIDETDAQIV